MSGEITFGTDGWRAVIGEGFTFDNVRRVCDAIASACRQIDPPPGTDSNTLIVGYDRRFLSAEFASSAAETLRAAGYRVILGTSPIPSQAVSFAARNRKVLGGVVITASHNPAKYNGVKFKAWYGGSALPETYRLISDALGQSARREGGVILEEDLLEEYVAGVREQVDVAKIRSARLSILHDPIHGAAATIPSRVLGLDYLGNARILRGDEGPIEETFVDGLRGETNPSFGGFNPEPIPENLAPTRNVMLSGRYDLAICNDGDADRLGILDEGGHFVSPHKIISLLALYLARDQGRRGDIVKTFSTTRLIETIAERLGATLHETAIGFKYVADLMLTRDVLIGGEESGGIGFGHFLPERDGILSGLLVVECVAHHGKALSTVIGEMEKEFGALHFDRRDLYRPRKACMHLIESVRTGDMDRAFGRDFTSREEKDGVKMNFADGSWILFRQSGTEPLIRIYCESPDAARVQEMLRFAITELDRG